MTFGYTNARSGQRKTCTVGVEEFVRRFLQHVLPKEFGKVRYYGLFSSGRRELLGRVRQLLSCAAAAPRQDPELAAEPLPVVEFLCPACA
jgi:hypothetical protein